MKAKYRQFHLTRPRKTAKQVMRDFLQDCLQPSDRIEVNQPRQVYTMARAVREGYVTESGELLEKGRALMQEAK